jgi:hypothetical protein
MMSYLNRFGKNMEKSKFVIQLMNIPLDAALCDGEGIAE